MKLFLYAFAFLGCFSAQGADVQQTEGGAAFKLEKPGLAVVPLGGQYLAVFEDAQITAPQTASPITATAGSAVLLNDLPPNLNLHGKGTTWELKAEKAQHTPWAVLLTKDGMNTGLKPRVVQLPNRKNITVTPFINPQPWRTKTPTSHGLLWSTLGGLALEKGKVQEPPVEKKNLSPNQVAATAAKKKTEEKKVEPTPKSAKPPATQQEVTPKTRPLFAENTTLKPSSFDKALDKLWAAINAVENIPVPGEEADVDLFSPPPEVAEGASTTAPTVAERVRDDFLPDPAVVTPDQTYVEQLAAIHENLILAEDKSGRERARFDKGKLLLTYGRPTEALAAFALMESRSDGFPEYDAARLYNAIALALTGDAQTALNILEEDLDPENHRLLWQALAYENLRQNNKAADLLKKHLPITQDYPQALWLPLRLAEARALLAEDRLAEVVVALEDLQEKIGGTENVPPEAKYILAQALLQQGDEETALHLLAEAASATRTRPAIAYQAQYDYVRLLYGRRDITRKQTIEHLEDLRTLWKGNALEQEILFQLGELYREEKMFRESLERFKTYTIYYPNAQNQAEVNSLLVKTFLEAFAPKNIARYEDGLSILGMYYDFRELTPPGKSGDRLISDIGHRLLKMGLNKRAILLLTAQLDHRVKDPIQRAELGLYIAELHLDAASWQEGLDILKRTNQDVLPKKLKEKRTLVQVRLLMSDERYDEAQKALIGLKGPEAWQAKVDVAWAQGDERALVGLLEKKFAKPDEDPETAWGPVTQRNFLSYAYALNRLGRLPELEELKKTHAQKIDVSKLMAGMEFLRMDLGAKGEDKKTPATETLDKVVEQLANYNNFSQRYQDLQEERAAENLRRSQFNRRLRRPQF